MNSSSAPAGADGLGLVAAARVHARRFHKPLLSSLVALAAADQLITHPDGGVLAITQLDRPWKRLATTTTAYLALVAFTAVAVGQRRYVAAVASSVALLAVIVLAAPAASRQLRFRAFRQGEDATWLITDTAAEPHRRVGDELMRIANDRADAAHAALVLVVRCDNGNARQLYERHGFAGREVSAGRLALRRAPGET